MKKIVLVLLTFLCVGLGAATIHVPSDYITIQSALDVAVEGDSILVAAGTYVETITWPLVDGISVLGDGSAVTIIDADHQGCVMSLASSYDQTVHFSNTYISGFTLCNGYSTAYGAGIDLEYAHPTLNDLVVTDCHGEGVVSSGGGLQAYQSAPVITNCVFAGNSAYAGGGLFFFAYSAAILNNVMVVNNSVSDNSGFGNGIYTYYDSNVSMTGCLVANNNAEGRSAMEFDYNVSPTLNQCTISGNDCALLLRREAGVTITNSNFLDNTVSVYDYNSASYPDILLPNLFWGNVEGPYGEVYNPGGTGNELIGPVNPVPVATSYCLGTPPPLVSNLTLASLSGNEATFSWQYRNDVMVNEFRIGWNITATHAYPEGWVDVTGTQATVTLPGEYPLYIRVAPLRDGAVAGWFGEPVVVGANAVDDDTQPTEAMMVTVYPNPARNMVNVEFSIPANRDASTTLYDMRGRFVRQIQTGRNGCVIDCRDLCNGVYFLRVVSGNSCSTHKVLVLK